MAQGGPPHDVDSHKRGLLMPLLDYSKLIIIQERSLSTHRIELATPFISSVGPTFGDAETNRVFLSFSSASRRRFPFEAYTT